MATLRKTIMLTDRQDRWIKAQVALSEECNREVRRVLEHLGHPVNRLIRTAYGSFHLGNLPRGMIAETKRKTLREQLGREV